MAAAEIATDPQTGWRIRRKLAGRPCTLNCFGQTGIVKREMAECLVVGFEFAVRLYFLNGGQPSDRRKLFAYWSNFNEAITHSFEDDTF